MLLHQSSSIASSGLRRAAGTQLELAATKFSGQACFVRQFNRTLVLLVAALRRCTGRHAVARSSSTASGIAMLVSAAAASSNGRFAGSSPEDLEEWLVSFLPACLRQITDDHVLVYNFHVLSPATAARRSCAILSVDRPQCPSNTAAFRSASDHVHPQCITPDPQLWGTHVFAQFLCFTPCRCNCCACRSNTGCQQHSMAGAQHAPLLNFLKRSVCGFSSSRSTSCTDAITAFQTVQHQPPALRSTLCRNSIPASTYSSRAIRARGIHTSECCITAKKTNDLITTWKPLFACSQQQPPCCCSAAAGCFSWQLLHYPQTAGTVTAAAGMHAAL